MQSYIIQTLVRKVLKNNLILTTDIKTVLTVIFIILITFLLIQHFINIQNYPPGPFPLPFIGNLHQINKAYPYKSIIKWQNKYGNVFTIWLPKPTVIIAEWKTLQKILLGEHCLDRPASFVYGLFTNHKPEGDGIILSSGNTWRMQRRFAIKVLKNLGMGSNKMEKKINFHKDELIKRLANSKFDKNDESIIIEDINFQLSFCFGNIIHDLIMGRHYEYNDPEFKRFKNHIDNILKLVASVPMLIIDCYPWTRFFFPQYYKYLKNCYALQKFFLKEINQHAKSLNINSESTNFIDAYLQKMFQLKDLNLSTTTLVLDAGDLWTGGLETVVTTLTWAIIYLIRYPKVQKQLRAELNSQLQNKSFEMINKQKLPYLHATIDELQRIVNILPWHIPHAINTDMIIDNKFISSGTTIMPQFGAVFFNEVLFPNSDEFMPERFLKKINTIEEVNQNQSFDETIKKDNENISNNEQNLSNFNKENWKYVGSKYIEPFGIGKRACLGKGLAKMELFIVLAGLLQNFSFKQFNDNNLPSLEKMSGMTSSPKSFKCRIQRLNSELILSNN